MSKVKAAVLERSRRSTAGKRMSSLVGKAQEDDDAFWSHSIWSETGGGFVDKRSRKRKRDDDESSSSGSEHGGSGEGGSDSDSGSDGEGSYRMSDDDADAAVDQFDSDFDESESDEGEYEGGEAEEELELRAEERREAASRRRRNQRLGVPPRSSAGRDLMRKKTGRMTKRGPIGEGWNHGLVLNWPPSTGVPASVAKPTAHAHARSSSATMGAETKASMASTSQLEPQHVPTLLAAIDTGQRAKNLPSSPTKPNLRTTVPNAIDTDQKAKKPPVSPTRLSPRKAASSATKVSSAKLKQQRQAATSERKKSRRRQITQEEMILESIKVTETENAKWSASRKRSKEETAQQEKSAAAGNAKKSSLNQKPVSRFHSRRGCSNTLTFMDMDRLPEIFSARHPPTRKGSPAHHHVGLSPRRRRLHSDASDSGQPPPREAERNDVKCVITGKIARYRDPDTLFGYHDLDAYKELRQRVKSGELKALQTACNSIRRTKLPGSAIQARGQRSSLNYTTMNHFPFAADQPTMIAQIRSGGKDMRVIVTQCGYPVSPPPGAKVQLKLPGEEANAQRRLECSSKAAPNGKSRVTANKSNLVLNKQQPPLDKGLRSGKKKEPPLLPAPNGNRKATKESGSFANAPKKPIIINMKPAFYTQTTAKPIEQPQFPGAAGDVDIGNGRDSKEKLQPTGSSMSKVASTQLLVSNGGKAAASSTNTGTGKGISRSTDGDGGEKAPEIAATSNDQRKTIEAN